MYCATQISARIPHSSSRLVVGWIGFFKCLVKDWLTRLWLACSYSFRYKHIGYFACKYVMSWMLTVRCTLGSTNSPRQVHVCRHHRSRNVSLGEYPLRYPCSKPYAALQTPEPDSNRDSDGFAHLQLSYLQRYREACCPRYIVQTDRR